MQYISPFSFLPATPSSTFTRKDIVLAKRKLLAEFELLGTSTIIHNNKEISRNDVLVFFEQLERSNDLDFHALVASNKELLHFLETHKLQHHFNFTLDSEKVNTEFIEWLSPYYAAAFKDCSYQYFRKLQLPEFQVLINNQTLMTADDRYTSWQPVENYFHSLVQQFEHFNTHEVGGSDEAKISKFTKFEQVDIIALLPTDIFQHLINEYAFEMMRSSIDVFNRIQNQEWAIIILDNALSLPVEEENKIQLINKKNEMQDIMSKPAATYSSSNKSSGNNDSTWAIVRVIAFAIFFIYRLSTCNETTSYNADKYNSSTYYGNYTELIEKARKQTEFNSKVANHRITQDTTLMSFLYDLENDGTKINFKQTPTSIATGTDPYKAAWKLKAFAKQFIPAVNAIEKLSNDYNLSDAQLEPIIKHPLKIANTSKSNLIVFVCRRDSIYSCFINKNDSYIINLLEGSNKVYIYAGNEFAYTEDFKFVPDTLTKKEYIVKGKFINEFPPNLHLLRKPIYYSCSRNTESKTPAQIIVTAVKNSDNLKIDLVDTRYITHLQYFDELLNTTSVF